jgi:2-isopropylmalate synthase
MAVEAKPQLIYDWNIRGGDVREWPRPIEFVDESLRDGLQSPSVVDPPIETKIELVHLMDRLGIQAVDVGLPGAGPRHAQSCEALVRDILQSKLKIRPNCACRTLIKDITPVIEISERLGIPVEACTFIGSSPIRQYAEDWSIERLLRHTEEAVSYGVKHGIPVMYVTEDTTRAHPDTLAKLFKAAIHAGASRLCLCDTVGHVTPRGVEAVVRFARDLIDAESADVRLDWHGHNDRGLGVINSIVAVRTGVDRVHGTGIGIGERVGNTPLDQLLVNLRLFGWIRNDLSALGEYCRAVSRAVGVPIPINYPIVGSDAFRTGTGVHAAAVIKAMRKGDVWLADLVYSGVPAHWVGLEQKIEIGPMSGESNVIHWLEQHGIAADPALIASVFARAKESDRILTDEEIRAVLAAAGISWGAIPARPASANPVE